MSKPALFPETTPSGITVDSGTLERVIPESRRPDGSTRKEIKIRPGFTPQEDVKRFRGTKQQEMDARVLPKGHIIGWTPPPPATNKTADKQSGTMSKSQKKNEKRKEKKKADLAKKIRESWEDDDDDEDEIKPEDTTKSSNRTEITTEQIVEELEKLDVNDEDGLH